MKKSRFIIPFILVLVLVAGACFAVYTINSPEYALLQIKKDVDESGVDGLMPHLTDDAQKTVSTVISITENDKIKALMSFFGKGKGDSSVNIESEVQAIEWSIKDLLKGKDNAEVVLEFEYKNKLRGTIGIDMIREDNRWKISGIDIPNISK